VSQSRNQKARKIQGCHASRVEGDEKPAPDRRAKDSHHEIEEISFSDLVDDYAANDIRV
jgi:hypothetical protein